MNRYLKTFTTPELEMMLDRHLKEPGALSRGFTTCLCGDVAATRLGVTCDREERLMHPKEYEISMLSKDLYYDLFYAADLENIGVSMLITTELAARSKSGWIDKLIEDSKKVGVGVSALILSLFR